MATHQQIDRTRSGTSKRAHKSKSQAGPHPAQILQRLESAPGSIRPADVLTLQRTIGNRATGRILQAKLKLGPAGDQYEQEADRVAKEVVSASRQPEVQRAGVDEDELQAKPIADRISQVRRDYLATARVQRNGMEEEELQAKRTFAAASPTTKVQRAGVDEEELQAKPNHGLEGGEVDDSVAQSIQSAKGSGQPLHDGVRRSMEQGFGADFSGVRVHTGGDADTLNRSLNARAFTTGNDIFFGKGQYNPGSTGGQELIAHELTHTVQQGAATTRRQAFQAGTLGGQAQRKHQLQDSQTHDSDRAALSAQIHPSTAAEGRIQRYVKENNWGGSGLTMRVSEDGQMATPDADVFKGTHVLYATPAVINSAIGKLAAVESPYTVTQGSDTLTGKIPGSGSIFKKAKTITLHEVIPSDTRKNGSEASGDTLKTIEACSAHGLDFMGIGTESSQQKASNREAQITAGTNIVTNTGSGMVKGKSDIDARDFLLIAIARQELGLGDDAPNPTLREAKDIYSGLSDKKRGRYAQQYGINQYAQPDVGEGVEAIRAAGTLPPKAFPMHFAPVIAKSGTDYVTLENYARSKDEQGEGDSSNASNQWYFRMYGTYKKGIFKDDDQSYYGQHAKEGSLGSREELMGLHNRNVAKQKVEDED